MREGVEKWRSQGEDLPFDRRVGGMNVNCLVGRREGGAEISRRNADLAENNHGVVEFE